MNRASAWFALLLDAICLLVFAAAGRRSHGETSAIEGVLATAWPFAAGALAGWVVVALWRHRAPVEVRDGVPVWVGVVAVGMLLRVLTGAGTALSFVVVAAVVTGALLLGWRAVAAVLRRRTGRASPATRRPADQR